MLSVPISDFAIANEGLAKKAMEDYYPCCGKTICKGCVHSFRESGNIGNCPFCKFDGSSKKEDERMIPLQSFCLLKITKVEA
jgi:hypothetical protein